MTGDLRCRCGSLLMRVIGHRVEIKCRRCKRVVSIPFGHGAPDRHPAWVEVDPFRGRSGRIPADT